MATTPKRGLPLTPNSVKISALADADRLLATALDDQLDAIEAEAVAAGTTAAFAAAGPAVDAEIEIHGLVSAQNLDADKFEIADSFGGVLLSVDDINGYPFFTANPGVRTEPLESDSFEVTDDFGNVLWAIDNLSTLPVLRGGERETHFIISAGQSNPEGQGGPIVTGTNNTLSNLLTVPQRGPEAGQHVLAADPLWHPYNDARTGKIGHVVTVARQYALDNPDVQVVILPMANSGTGFFLDSTGYTWAPSRVGEAGIQNLYSLTIEKCNASIAGFTGPSRVAAILWHQGEADAVAGTTQETYRTELAALIAGFRANITGAAEAPCIVGQLGWEFRNVRQPGTWAQIDAAHQQIPSTVLGTAFAPAPGEGFMLPDNTHFTAHGQKLLAASILNVLPDAYYNL